MQVEASWRGGRSVQDWIMLISGLMLFAAPWAMGFDDDVLAARTAWVGGIVIAVMGLAALVQFAEWEDWVALVAGVLMIVAPWTLGFGDLHAAVWAFVLLGLITALASVSEIYTLHTPERAARS